MPKNTLYIGINSVFGEWMVQRSHEQLGFAQLSMFWSIFPVRFKQFLWGIPTLPPGK